jgi:hypothetical protein
MLQTAGSDSEVGRPSLLSDVTGRIEHVFFALPSYDRNQASLLLACFRDVLQALEPGVRVTLLRRAELASLADAELSQHGRLDTIDWDEGFVLRLRDAKATVHGSTLRISRLALPDFTSWVQDPFLIANENTQPCVWASPVVKREYGGWDDELPHRLARHLGWPLRLLPAGVEAGNVLVDDRHVVIGSDVPKERGDDWPALRDRLHTGGRDLIVPDAGQRQPVFHLDLCVTLAGPDARGTHFALVGSVQRACALTAQPFDDKLALVEQRLDAVAASLTGYGYRVKRLPLVPIEVAHFPEGAWLSYNNCLVQVWTEAGEQRRVVVMPGFAGDETPELEAADRAATEVWSELGFEVRIARGAFTRMAEFGGSLRCMTKVLRRA